MAQRAYGTRVMCCGGQRRGARASGVHSDVNRSAKAVVDVILRLRKDALELRQQEEYGQAIEVQLEATKLAEALGRDQPVFHACVRGLKQLMARKGYYLEAAKWLAQAEGMGVDDLFDLAELVITDWREHGESEEVRKLAGDAYEALRRRCKKKTEVLEEVLASLKLAQSDPEQAVSHFREGMRLQKDPTPERKTELGTRLAAALMDAGRLKEAETAQMMALHNIGKYPVDKVGLSRYSVMVLRLARILELRGKRSSLEHIYAEAVKLTERPVMGHPQGAHLGFATLLCQLLRSEGRHEDAESVIRHFKLG